MTRKYTLKRRAEQQAETRRRIVEAAIDLHGSVGPAATTFSLVAERAGVQRHTLYAHFPDERSLLRACSSTHMEANPLPSPESWREIAEPRHRTESALLAIYEWYGRNEGLVASVLRDAEHHPPTREAVETSIGLYFEACQEVLGQGLDGSQRSMLQLALSFFTWRTLVREAGLQPSEAVNAMVGSIHGAA
ncbi:TetR/AcrR family transcriptional regulator [Mesorhizobium sp. WSM3860]|uniref:TetR/AcrR family transcriptional regulator n=1 Tax=Mesorhizobium sp. WSM3860 TaxID=2029403 RepID=UPI000BB05490|nr:TetR/AcrR family transcriptional regulator [Mesorhizobium sp. WSM3860]PBC05914.1 TetR family transcriptional regulator [Mesorhizobium sp. WSM3860]